MGRALARDKTSGRKPHRAVRSIKKVKDKPKVKAESSHRKKTSSSSKVFQTAKQKTHMKIGKKGVRHSKAPVSGVTRSTEAETRKPIVTTRITSAPETPPRLLRESKTTAAALGLLEKGIKLIYQKDFKKARAELKLLIDTYPVEAEIVARARSYIQICDREEAAHKKQATTNDQLYTVGVMEHNRGNYDAAIACFQQSLEEHPNADHIVYSLAASLAMKRNALEAIANLRKAIKLNENNRIYTKNDTDFSSLQNRKEFSDLVGISLPSADESQQ